MSFCFKLSESPSSWVLVMSLGLSLGASAQTITVYSAGAVPVGQTRQLTAYVPLSPNSVAWLVNGVPGGSATLGTVDTLGRYSAPTHVPQPSNVVTVSARSTAYPEREGSVQLTITQVPPRLWGSQPSRLPVGGYRLTLNGAAFPSSGLSVRLGDQTLTPVWISSTQLQISGVAPSAWAGSTQSLQVWTTGAGAVGSDVVRLAVDSSAAPAPVPAPAPAPAPAPSPAPAPAPPPPAGSAADLAAARFLEQASFGPNASAVAQLRQLGTEVWLNQQFLLPETVIDNPGGQAMTAVIAQFLQRLTDAPDQLRQRVAYALAQVLVISANKNIYPDELVPHLRNLSRHAFGNYRALLEEVTRSAQMGKYLDLANSNRPLAGSAANENFARELLQLFSIGLVRLNMDGTPQLDLAGRPQPTYDQASLQQVALALTGWTYTGSGNNNWENFSAPLVARDINHDLRAKNFLGCSLPANQGAEADLRATLDCVYQHPNVPPFMALRLIRQLVKSNPSPAYVQRVATVFANDGQGQRGNLRAVVRAILLDPEARNDALGPNDGRLRDPLQHVAATLRALNGGFQPDSQLGWELGRAGQHPLAPPSVFGHYAQLFRLPQSSLSAPEFQIYTPTEATLRANFLWGLLTQSSPQMRINLTPYTAVAGDTTALIQAVDRTLLWGRMPAAMRQSLANAINAQPDATQRVRTALYLTLLSGFHAVQH